VTAPRRGRTTSTEPISSTASVTAAPAGGGWTRFAPAPTGYLHLGHVANAIWVWGLAGVTGSRVLLRIEDHDHERSRAEFDAAILEDLDWLGFVPDAGPVRQRDDVGPFVSALERLRGQGLVYACDCSRTTFATWAANHGRSWRGPGCPGGCRDRTLPDVDGPTLRVALGSGRETWTDRLLGPRAGDPSSAGDPLVRDRHGNWTYGFAVVVDDLRQEISLVVRGEDLVEATPAQLRLGRLLGRDEPPTFAHHPLIRKPSGAKLSKADGDTGVRDLRGSGWSPGDVIGAAAEAVGLLGEPRSLAAGDVVDLMDAHPSVSRSPT
jgi:glutamyl-Q tRNA(Asp) synthetase